VNYQTSALGPQLSDNSCYVRVLRSSVSPLPHKKIIHIIEKFFSKLSGHCQRSVRSSVSLFHTKVKSCSSVLFVCLFVAILSENFGAVKEFKNSVIMLKFGTIIDWINTCYYYFFFQNLNFWVFGTPFVLIL